MRKPGTDGAEDEVQCPPTLSPTRNVFDEQQACALEWKTPLWSKSWDVTGGAAT
ncbi:unnamed protein product [Durusdinium trenchii]|uniref:Uncharacterized protein n=1 Tax=Durusdinium trenchii TaxID=1381693 RepID=A0ABP0RUL3_9DINO